MSRKDEIQAALTGFIEHEDFTAGWKRLGLGINELMDLQDLITRSPSSGVVIRGGGGIRKIRFAIPGKGKRGGVRVIYVSLIAHHLVILLDVFAKNEKENLTRDEIARRAAIAAEIGEALDGGS